MELHSYSEFTYLEISEFIKSIFDEFIAPTSTERGVQEFYRYIDPVEISSRQKKNHFIITSADEHNRLSGMIEVRNYGHISMLFVRSDLQKQGIGRNLLNKAVEICETKTHPFIKLTLNSSPNAVDAYKTMGFFETDDEQVVNGIRFIPMEKRFI